MFENDYVFKGKYANIVTRLTSEIDSKTKFKLFERNIDVLIIAPIIGYLYGRRANREESGQNTDNVKKINYQQMSNESSTLNFNYQLIMLLHDREKLSIEDRLDRAFRYTQDNPEKETCDRIYEQYIFGGIEVLEEKLLNDATNVDDYINNIYNFICDYNDRYNKTISEEEILKLCMNN